MKSAVAPDADILLLLLLLETGRVDARQNVFIINID